jgi:voltage-gated potassium channel
VKRAGVFARLRIPLVLVAVAVAYGTAGYQLVEGWDPLDAFYMTVTTLTTVGYGEVHPLDAAGKLFTISLLALGVVALAAAISAFTQLVAGGELASWLRRKRMDTSLGRMRGHYIVCAYGRVGRAAVAQLRGDGVPCLVVEAKPELASLLEEHDVPHLTADPTQEAVLRRAGVDQASGLLCAVDSDAINVYITLTARAMNPRLTIVARASDPESADKLRRAGADHVVSPYEVSGSRMGVLALHPAIVSFMDMVRVAPGWRLEEVEVRPGARLDGTAIGQIRTAHPEVRILAVTQRGAGAVAFPAHEMTLGPGDLVLLLGPAAAVQATAG